MHRKNDILSRVKKLKWNHCASMEITCKTTKNTNVMLCKSNHLSVL